MMNLGAMEMLLLGVVALILFGPRRLPELGRALGEGLAAFRESSRQLSQDFRRQLEDETRAENPSGEERSLPPAAGTPMPEPGPAATVAVTAEFVEEPSATPAEQGLAGQA